MKMQETVSAVNARILRIVSATDIARTEDVLSEMKRQLIQMDLITSCKSS
jgi:hypothetical protein